MLNGQVALVTGASRGIGQATAIAFAKAGAKVVMTARHESALTTAAEQIARLNGACLPVPADVTDEASVRRLVERAVSHFGRIDILVNNAGAYVYGPAERATSEDWDTVIGTNLKGPFLCVREIIPIMARTGGGHIINVASQTGLFGFPNLAIYCASKSGLIGLSRSLGRELLPSKIRVSYICPGYVDTGMLAVFPREKAAQTAKVSAERVAQEILRLAATAPCVSLRCKLLRKIARAWRRGFGGDSFDTYSSF